MEKIKKYAWVFYAAVFVVAIITAIALLAGFKKDRNNNEAVEMASQGVTLEKGEDKILVSVSTETIQSGLENMGFLVTQEYYFTQVEKYTKEKKLFNLINSSSEFMYSYDGAVFAGVDFEKITVTKDDSTKTITVDIPDAEIHTVSIDKDTFQIYSEKEYLWNPLNLDDYNISMDEFEDTAREKALDSGILERADEQARLLVSNFVANFPAASGYEVVYE